MPWPVHRHRRHVPRVKGPFVAPQGLGALPLVGIPDPIPNDVPISGVSFGDSDTTGAATVQWVLDAASVGVGTDDRPRVPGPSLYPGEDLYPGPTGAPLGVIWGLAGSSTGTSSTRAGVTSLGGTSVGQSATGSWWLPGTALYPSGTLYPGATTLDFGVYQAARPVSDVDSASWVVTPLWSKLDEDAASDADLVTGVAV